MKLHMIAAATLALGTTAALAQDDGEATPQAQTAQAAEQQQDGEMPEVEDNDGDEVVCRTERVTGSLTRRTRTCLTRNEWAAIEARTRDEMNRMGRNASGGKSCNRDQFGGC